MLRKKDKENKKAQKQSGCAQENTSPNSKKKILKTIGIGTAVAAGTMAAAEFGTRAYKVKQEEKLNETMKFNVKKMQNQTYDVYRCFRIDYKALLNENIDSKIIQKEREINLLKKRLNNIKIDKFVKKEREYNHLQLLIQNKEICLDFLRRKKEKQEIISQHLGKRKALTTEKEKISFLHPKKKKEFEKEIVTCENNITDCYNEYRSLESQISESEEKEKILAKKYSVAKRTGIKIFMVVVVITVILICVFILRLLA